MLICSAKAMYHHIPSCGVLQFLFLGLKLALAFYRFAVLDGPTIPIIGEGDEEANDRSQLSSNSKYNVLNLLTSKH